MIYMSCPAKGAWRLFFAASLLWLASALHLLNAQDFSILDVKLDRQNRLHLRHIADTNSYYVLYRGDSVGDISTPVAMTLGANGPAELIGPSAPPTSTGFYRIRWQLRAFPLDLDHDG